MLGRSLSKLSLQTSLRSLAALRGSRSYTVPIVLESGTMGERSFDIFSRLLRERIICVHGEVTDMMASLVTAQLLFLEAENPEQPVYMYINSPGGLVTAGMAMYDTMQYIRPQVHTICMGQAASMGSVLLAGGEPGRKFFVIVVSLVSSCMRCPYLTVLCVSVCLSLAWKWIKTGLLSPMPV